MSFCSIIGLIFQKTYLWGQSSLSTQIFKISTSVCCQLTSKMHKCCWGGVLSWSDQPPLLGLQGRPAHSVDLIKLFPHDGSVVLELRLPAPSVLLPPPFESEKNTVNRQRRQEYGCLVFDSIQGNLVIFLHFHFGFH